MSGSKSNGRKPFRPIYRLNGIRKTRIPLAIARDSPCDAALGNGPMASAQDADPVRKHCQSPVHLENFMVGPAMDSRIDVCGRSCPYGIGSCLSQGGCPGAACRPDAHGVSFL